VSLTLGEQIQQLEKEYRTAEKDVINDVGEDVLNSGGYSEVAHAVAQGAGPEISVEARSEFLRMQGLSTEFTPFGNGTRQSSASPYHQASGRSLDDEEDWSLSSEQF
jgi:hypothetical protein